MSFEELGINLFGGVQLSANNDAFAKLPIKGQALFCYLAVTGRIHARTYLAGLLWPESTESSARRSLRVNLVKVRPLKLLLIERQTLAFNNERPYILDVEAFETLIKESERVGRSTEDIRAKLEDAVELYKGEFMAGFDMPDSAEFQNWLVSERERLGLMAIDALDRLIRITSSSRDYEAGVRHARHLLNLDELRESAHRQLMELLVKVGQRSEAMAQYERCKEILQRELGVDPEPETTNSYYQIRDGEGAQPAIRVIAPDDIVPPEIPFQVPSRVQYFVGRDTELKQLQSALTNGHRHRIYGLVGMGGIGKTSLSIQAAHALRDSFPDGVLWANATTNDPMTIAENWASAYGYDFSGLADLDDRAAALRRVLHKKKALLIFDDVTVAARIRSLIPERGTPLTLLNSRRGDVVRGLGGQMIQVTELPLENSRQLLTRIIQSEQRKIEETAVDEICRILHNLPLAVDIAGRYLAQRPRRRLGAFVEQLQRETSRLDLQLGDREVRATFGISWQALDDTPRKVFATLAVFEGRSFTSKAVTALIEDIPDNFVAQDRLHSLANLSLIQVEGDDYYRQHPLLADFAAEKLTNSEEAYRLMVQYYLGFVNRFRQNYATLRPEWANLTASIQKAHQFYLWDTVIEFSQTLEQAWFARGRFSEALQAYELAQEAAMALEDEDALGRVFLQWGKASIEQNKYREAQALLLKSLSIFEEAGDQKRIGDAKYELARVALEQELYDNAEALLLECLQIREALDDQVGIANIMYRQARMAYSRRNDKKAQLLCGQALTIQDAVGDKLGSIRTLRLFTQTSLALSAKMGEEPDRQAALVEAAEIYCARAMQLCEEMQDRVERAMTLLEHSNVARTRRNYDEAHRNAETSLQMLTTMGDRRMQALALYRLSLISADLHNYEEALERGHQSLELCYALDADSGKVHALLLLGKIYRLVRSEDKATEMWKQAFPLADKLQLSGIVADLKQLLAGSS